MKTQLMPRLKDGVTLIGKYVEEKDSRLILQKQDGSQMALPMTREFISALELCESQQPILEISMRGNTYEIFELDGWPDGTEEK